MARPEDKIVLIVDDEPDIVIYLQTALEDAGFNVMTAGDGEEALEKIRVRKPDFISLDLVMPRKSGIRLLYELRRNREWSKIPFIVITGHARDEEYRQGLESIMTEKTLSGKQIYLEKPVKPLEFVALVCRELGITLEAPAPPEDLSLQQVKQELADMLAVSDPATLRRLLQHIKKEQECPRQPFDEK
jgi:CheY-like chemotaxis protein